MLKLKGMEPQSKVSRAYNHMHVEGFAANNCLVPLFIVKLLRAVGPKAWD